MINSKTKLICLLGSPIKHSFSPDMHNVSLKSINVNAQYMAFDIKSELLEKTIIGLKAMDFIGANITIPHKTDIIKYLDFIDEKAKLIGAVNTIYNHDGYLHGYNTDIDGFLESLKIRNIDLKNKKIAILGTGGVSKAIIIGLLLKNVSFIDVFSRNILKANEIKNNIKIKNECINAKSYGDFNKKYPYDIIINTTPVGMYPNVNDSILNVKEIGDLNTIFYDVIYNPLETKFLKDARESNRLTINGLDMLILQGIFSLKIWFPDFDVENKITIDTVTSILKKNHII